MEKYITIKKGKEASIQRRHPWIFSGAIQVKGGKPGDGDIVEIRDILGNVLGFGHYQNYGSIAVRVLSFSTDAYGDGFWYEKLKNAYDVRNQINIMSSGTDCYRLIHG